MARAGLPAPGVSPEMGDSGCWRPRAHSLGILSFHRFPITSSHFKLDLPGTGSASGTGVLGLGKSHKLRNEQAKAKSPVFILSSCQMT